MINKFKDFLLISVIIIGVLYLIIWSSEDKYKQDAYALVIEICTDSTVIDKYEGEFKVDLSQNHLVYDNDANLYKCTDPNLDTWPKPKAVYANARNFVVNLFD